MAGGLRAFWAVIVVLFRPLVGRALSLFVAVGLPGAIVFAPQGMHARDLVRAIDQSLLVRILVCGGWLLLSAPASRFVFTAPGTTMLRALNASRAPALAALFTLLLFVQLPWLALFVRGAGVLEAIGFVLSAILIHASIIASSRRRRHSWMLLVGVVSLANVSALPLAVLAPWSVYVAWKVAPEHPDAAFGRLGGLGRFGGLGGWIARLLLTATRSSKLLTLVVMHLLRIVRLEHSRISIATMLTAIGGAGLFTLGQLGELGEQSSREHPLPRAMAIMALPLAVASSLFVAPLLDLERQIRPLLLSLRVKRSVIALAFLTAIATPTTALAATAGAIASTRGVVPSSSSGSGAAAAALTGGLMAWSIVLCAIVGTWGRRHDQTRDRSAALFALGVILIAMAAIAVAFSLGPG